MPLASGLASSVGLAAETTYGTYAAPTRFQEVVKPTLAKVKNTTQGGGLAAGRLVAPAARRVFTSRAASGSLQLEVTDAKWGMLLGMIFGGSPTPTQLGATTAYSQAYPLQDHAGKTFTAQAGVPDLTGVVNPYTFLGSKVAAAEFSCGVDAILSSTITLDCRDVVESQSLVAPSYPAGLAPFHFGQSLVKIGTFGSETQVDAVRSITLKIDRGMKVDRFYQGNAGLKREPLTNDLVKITGTFETDFMDKTVFADRFRDDTPLSLVWSFTGGLISGSYYKSIAFALPAVYVEAGTPVVDGPDVVQPKFTFTALSDGTNNPITCTYISTDTTA